MSPSGDFIADGWQRLEHARFLGGHAERGGSAERRMLARLEDARGRG